MFTVVVPPTQRAPRSATTPRAPPSIGAKRTGHQKSWFAFASQRVKSAAVRCGPHSSRRTVRPRSASSPAMTPPPAPDPTTTTSKRSLIEIPRYDQSFASRVASGRVEVDLLPGSGRVDTRRDEVAVERLDREGTHPEEVGRADAGPRRPRPRWRMPRSPPRAFPRPSSPARHRRRPQGERAPSRARSRRRRLPRCEPTRNRAPEESSSASRHDRHGWHHGANRTRAGDDWSVARERVIGDVEPRAVGLLSHDLRRPRAELDRLAVLVDRRDAPRSLEQRDLAGLQAVRDSPTASSHRGGAGRRAPRESPRARRPATPAGGRGLHRLRRAPPTARRRRSCMPPRTRRSSLLVAGPARKQGARSPRGARPPSSPRPGGRSHTQSPPARLRVGTRA